MTIMCVQESCFFGDVSVTISPSHKERVQGHRENTAENVFWGANSTAECLSSMSLSPFYPGTQRPCNSVTVHAAETF